MNCWFKFVLSVVIAFALFPAKSSGQCDVTDGMLIELQGTTTIDGLLRGSSGCIVATTIGTPLALSGGVLTIAQSGATTGQVLQWNGSAWVPATVDTDPLNEAWTIDGDDADSEVISTQVVKFQGGGIATTDYVPGTNTLLITATEVDGSVSNEGSLSVGAGGANTSTIVSNTSGSTAVTISGSNTVLVTESGSTITLQADTSLLATVNDLKRFERFAFSTTAPSDTNYLWAKLNSSPWKLDSVFAYEFGSWHIEGFYDRISGIFSKKPPLFVVATGQSNMLGIDGGGDTTSDRRLVAWDTTAHVWKVANLGVNPFNSTGANSLAFSFGKEVARRENRIVRLVVMAKSSQHIAQWFGVGGHAYNTNMNVLQSGMPRCDVILWHQGESNHDGAVGICNADACYEDSLYAIIRQFRGYTWADEQTLFIAGGLYDGAGATQNDRNTALMLLNTDTISTTGFAYATDLDDSGDAVHFSGPALVTLGTERYYNVFRALPHLYNQGAGAGGSTAIPANEIAYGNGSGITSSSALNYTSSKLGVGTTSPAQELDVTGDVLVRGHIRINAVGDSSPVVIKMPATYVNSKSAIEVWNNAGTTLVWRITRTSSNNNMFIGNGGLSATGSQMLSYGPNALLNATSAVDALGFGYRSLEALISGTKDVGLGSLSLLGCTTCFSVLGIGYGAAAGVVNGYQIVSIGTQSMVNAGASVNGIVSIGTQNLQFAGGNNITSIGHLAAQNHSSGNDGVFIGALTGRNALGSGLVYLGPNQSFTITESNRLRIHNAADTISTLSGDFTNKRIGISLGANSITRTLDVNGEMRVRDLTTTTPTVFAMADANGVFSSATPSGEFALSAGAVSTNFATAISPSQLTTMTNNWNPTGLSTAWIVRVDGDAGFQVISGITAPTTNKRLALWNVGSNAVLLPAENQSSSAANRFAFGRDVILFPGKTVEIVYDLTSSRWRMYSQSGLYDNVQHLYFNEQFSAPVSGTGGDYSFWDISSTSVSTAAPVAGRWSGITVNTGSSASGLGYVASKDVFWEFSTSSGTATWAYCKAVIKTPASLSDASNDYTIRVGFNATTGGGGASDGMYFDYNHAISSGNWSCATTNAGNTQRNSSGVAVAVSTVYVLEIVCRPNLSVEFFVNGTRVATNDTWIPTGDDLLCMAEIEKSVGTTQRDLTVHTLQTSIALVK